MKPALVETNRLRRLMPCCSRYISALCTESSPRPCLSCCTPIIYIWRHVHILLHSIKACVKRACTCHVKVKRRSCATAAAAYVRRRPRLPVVAGGINDIATVRDRLDDGARNLLVSLLVFVAKVCPCVHPCVVLYLMRPDPSERLRQMHVQSIGNGAVHHAHMIRNCHLSRVS
jgi:hypothetical protein